MVRLHLLKAEHVRGELAQVPYEIPAPEVPRQRPRGAVGVGFPEGVEVGENIVRDHSDCKAAVRPRAHGRALVEAHHLVVAYDEAPARGRRGRLRDDHGRVDGLGHACALSVRAQRRAHESESPAHIVRARHIGERVRHVHPLVREVLLPLGTGPVVGVRAVLRGLLEESGVAILARREARGPARGEALGGAVVPPTSDALHAHGTLVA
mmetsp:Transcript_3361/g.9625  ORF Transcript_3361/g.9625 Transcript_3361/m.9625 type:complete len:209 (+) Transcript_3361:1301-1927(+)